jgi:hypothetical protein
MYATTTITDSHRSPSFDTRSALASVPRQYVPGTVGLRVINHDVEHGFCTVCGAVWPCARARRDQLAAELAAANRADA